MATDLVEVHVGDAHPVELGLDRGQGGEGRMASVGHPRGEPGSVEDPDDLGMGAGVTVVRHRDDGPCGAQPGAVDGLGAQLPAGEAEAVEDRHDLVERRPGVEEAPEDHVAGDPRPEAEPGDAGHVGSLRMRVTAMAAPKPLSIPTTLTPAAQLAIIDSRAVTPSRPAP